MRKFYIFHENYDAYVEAEYAYLEEGYLIFYNNEEISAIFAPGKWEYFKEVCIENL